MTWAMWVLSLSPGEWMCVGSALGNVVLLLGMCRAWYLTFRAYRFADACVCENIRLRTKAGEPVHPSEAAWAAMNKGTL